MGTARSEAPHMLSVVSQVHEEILDVIDDCRSQGSHHYVQLPQIIVCGDQSSGKSSALNAISRIQFPTKDNLCTRFATEVVLRRATETDIVISIIPGTKRSEEDKHRLLNFYHQHRRLEDLPVIVEAAKEAMGLGPDAKAFSDDILRIEVSGPGQPQLTVVDLPGLIHSENKQQSSEDVQLVQDLVKSYMRNSRSIILAVVSAKNDYANQIVTRLAREVDPKGIRTLGIITKPDTLRVGSESEKAFLDLAKNDNVIFRLGWHVLKNRDWDNRDCSDEERDRIEMDFLTQGAWAELHRGCIGIANLNPRLSTVLTNQIVSELPYLIRDFELGIQQSKQRLDELGMARNTKLEQKTYLVKISENFGALVKTAVDGSYVDEYFGDPRSREGYSKRLRAVIQRHLSTFEERMRREGHKQEILSDETEVDPNKPSRVTRKQYLENVRDLMRRTRGRELSGMYNPLLIGDMFFYQAQPWRQIANEYRDKVLESVNVFLNLTMKYTMSDKTREGLDRHIFRPALKRLFDDLEFRIGEVLRPHEKGHPITYNHYFIENIQRAREDLAKKEAVKKLYAFLKRPQSGSSSHINLQSVDIQQLAEALSKTTEPDMELFACSEATECMQAYYKVALKIFVDSFATQAIEFGIMEKLSQILTPGLVMSLSEEVVHEIASESKESQKERVNLEEKLQTLERGLHALQLLTRHNLAHGTGWNFVDHEDDDDNNNEEGDDEDDDDDDEAQSRDSSIENGLDVANTGSRSEDETGRTGLVGLPREGIPPPVASFTFSQVDDSWIGKSTGRKKRNK